MLMLTLSVNRGWTKTKQHKQTNKKKNPE